MLGLNPNSLPLVYDKYACWDERLIDVAVHQPKFEVGMARLLQKPLGLRSRFLDVAREARHLFQFTCGYRPGRPRTEGPPHPLDEGNLAQRRRPAPPIDGKCEGAAHTHIVKRLVLDIETKEDSGHPRPLLNRELIL